MTERELAEAEQQLGVVMPDGYRQFLLFVDSGGMGPVGMRRLSRGPDGWGWEHDRETDLQLWRRHFQTRTRTRTGGKNSKP